MARSGWKGRLGRRERETLSKKCRVEEKERDRVRGRVRDVEGEGERGRERDHKLCAKCI